jgi:hypothetical protein
MKNMEDNKNTIYVDFYRDDSPDCGKFSKRCKTLNYAINKVPGSTIFKLSVTTNTFISNSPNYFGVLPIFIENFEYVINGSPPDEVSLASILNIGCGSVFSITGGKLTLANINIFFF